MDAETKQYVEDAILKQVEKQTEQFEILFNRLAQQIDTMKDDKSKILLQGVPAFIGGADNVAADVAADDHISRVSNQSHDSDVEIINSIIKPVFTNVDSYKKLELDNLKKLQEKALKRIPKLQFTTPQDADPNSLAPPLHNYGLWYRAFISYLDVLSPPLAVKIQEYVTALNVDDIISSDIPIPIPELDEQIYPFVTRASALGAITDTLSSDFEVFIETELDGTTANLFVTMKNLSVYCAPNSHQDRADHIAEFWCSTHDENECITKFQIRMEKAARDINNQYAKSQISPEQLYAATLAGIRKGGQFEAYKTGLNAIKISSSSSKRHDIKSRVLWLHNMCERDKLPAVFLQPRTVNVNSASMARTRGGGKGGKGKGGRGGGKGKGGGKGQRPVPGAVWNDTVYLVTDEDGDDQVAKRVLEKKNNQVCFNYVKFKKCNGHTNGTCPYNHEFKVVDTRKGSSSVSSPTPNPNNVPSAPTVSAAAENTPEPLASNNSSINTYNNNISNDISAFIANDDDYESAFDYSSKLGFSCNSVDFAPNPSYSNSTNYLYSKLTNTTTIYNLFEFMFISWFLCCSLPHLCASFVVLLGSFVSMSVNVCCSTVSFFSWSFTFLWYFLPVIISTLVQPLRSVAENIFSTPDLIGLYINNNIVGYIVSHVLSPLTLLSNLLLSTSNLLNSFPLLGFVVGVAIAYFRLKTSFTHFASAASFRHPIFKIILDCGCSFTMSGDLGLFIQSTLTPIEESVGLAESGKYARATHKGKIVVDGRTLDALYVPDFKQTMISMGQLERMGLLYTKFSENFRSFVTSGGDIFLSFYVAPDNLYPLLPRAQSSSSGSTREAS